MGGPIHDLFHDRFGIIIWCLLLDIGHDFLHVAIRTIRPEHRIPQCRRHRGGGGGIRRCFCYSSGSVDGGYYNPWIGHIRRHCVGDR